MQEDERTMAAQPPTGTPGGAGASPPPPSTVAGSPAERDELYHASDPEVRRRLEQQGRDNASLRAELEAERVYRQQQEHRLQQVEGHLNAQQRAQLDAHLAALPPDERAEARINLLENRLSGLQNWTTQVVQQRAPRPQEDPRLLPEEVQQGIIRERAQEWIRNANQYYHLGPDDAITLEEVMRRTPMAGQSIPNFQAAVQMAAAMRDAQTSEGDVPRQRKSAQPGMEQAVQKETSRRLQDLGVGAPQAARAASPPGGTGTSEDLQAVARRKDLTPAQRMAALRAVDVGGK